METETSSFTGLSTINSDRKKHLYKVFRKEVTRNKIDKEFIPYIERLKEYPFLGSVQCCVGHCGPTQGSTYLGKWGYVQLCTTYDFMQVLKNNLLPKNCVLKEHCDVPGFITYPLYRTFTIFNPSKEDDDMLRFMYEDPDRPDLEKVIRDVYALTPEKIDYSVGISWKAQDWPQPIEEVVKLAKQFAS